MCWEQLKTSGCQYPISNHDQGKPSATKCAAIYLGVGVCQHCAGCHTAENRSFAQGLPSSCVSLARSPDRPFLSTQRVAYDQQHWQHLGACEKCRPSGPAPDLQNQSLHLSKSLCDWPAHSCLRNNEPDLSKILLIYKIRINTTFYLMRINGRIYVKGARHFSLLRFL